jgi:hypothetical protein
VTKSAEFPLEPHLRALGPIRAASIIFGHLVLGFQRKYILTVGRFACANSNKRNWN